MRLRVQVNKELFVDYPTTGTPQDFKNFMKGFLEYQADLMRDRIDEVIRLQLYNWKPLSPSYQKWKKSMGQDPRVWVQTGQTRKAIHVWFSPMAQAWFIGVHPTLRHRQAVRGGGYNMKKKGARLIDIIRWMEFGTPTMPARPLFTKVMDEFRKPSRQKALYADYLALQKGIIK